MNDWSGPELTVAVTTFNRADLIDETLTALRAQCWDGDWDIIFVDNNSTDGTLAILESWAEHMPAPTRIVEARAGTGPAYARNTAVANSTARSIAFVDDDDVVGAGWVAAIGSALRTHQLVGSRYDYERLNSSELAAANNFQTERLADASGAPTVSGGGMGCRRELWAEVGGQREDLRFGEDIDFCLRVAQLGTVTATFCPDALYHFRLRPGAVEAFRRGIQIGRSSVRLYKSHGRALGAKPDSLGLIIRVWTAYFLRLPALFDRQRRTVWAAQLGARIGRIWGSLAERTWYP